MASRSFAVRRLLITIDRLWGRPWGLYTNGTPRAIDRIDRAALGFWYFDIHAFGLYLSLMGPSSRKAR